MPRPLYVYGTLRDPDVLELVLGRVLAGAAATAPGYRAEGMPGRSYPGLRRQPGANAESAKLIIAPQAVLDALPPGLKTKAKLMKNGDTGDVNGIPVSAVPAYNTTPDRLKYHPK